MSNQQITHLITAAVSGAAFYWRWESPQKLWTLERILFLTTTATSMAWNIYMAVGG